MLRSNVFDNSGLRNLSSMTPSQHTDTTDHVLRGDFKFRSRGGIVAELPVATSFVRAVGGAGEVQRITTTIHLLEEVSWRTSSRSPTRLASTSTFDGLPEFACGIPLVTATLSVTLRNNMIDLLLISRQAQCLLAILFLQ